MHLNDLTLQGNDLLVGVHDGTLSRDGSSHNIIGIGQVNNNDLILLSDLLPHTNEVVRLEGQRLERVQNHISFNASPRISKFFQRGADLERN